MVSAEFFSDDELSLSVSEEGRELNRGFKKLYCRHGKISERANIALEIKLLSFV